MTAFVVALRVGFFVRASIEEESFFFYFLSV